MTEPTDAQLIEKYLAIRTHVATIKERHKEELRPYNDGMDAIEAAMAQRLIERGANNVNTDAGTAYRTTLMRPKVVDRVGFLNWAIAEENLDILDVGCLLDPLKAFMEKNNKALPPGIDVTTIVNTNFRKA